LNIKARQLKIELDQLHLFTKQSMKKFEECYRTHFSKKLEQVFWAQSEKSPNDRYQQEFTCHELEEALKQEEEETRF
jgi:hypothetical protein